MSAAHPLASAAAITDLVAERREEGLHLEFKTVAHPDAAVLTKDDRRTLGKAIAGMSNAEGGAVVVGIGTEKQAGLDVAAELKPMAVAHTLRDRLTGGLADMLDPQRPDILIHFVPAAQDGETGFLVIEIPASDRRPHMALPERVYYRRGSDGTRKMEHGEVRDLILAPREGRLELRLDVTLLHNGAMGPINFDAVFTLRNLGPVAIRAPYLRLLSTTDEAINPHYEAERAFGYRTRQDGIRGFVAGADFVLHANDEIRVARMSSGLRFIDDQRPNSVQAREILSGRIPDHHCEMGNLSFAGITNPRPAKASVDVWFGAENVRLVARTIPFGRRDLLALIAKQL